LKIENVLFLSEAESRCKQAPRQPDQEQLQNSISLKTAEALEEGMETVAVSSRSLS
jgi:hypothetical protein